MSKYYYFNKVTRDELQQYGFSDIEVSNLNVLSQFILNAINPSYSNSVTFSVSSTNNAMWIRITIIDTVINNQREINIPLQKVQINKVDISEEHFIDLKQDIKELNETIQNEIRTFIPMKGC